MHTALIHVKKISHIVISYYTFGTSKEIIISTAKKCPHAESLIIKINDLFSSENEKVITRLAPGYLSMEN